MLEVVANALRSPAAQVIEDCCGYYQNADGILGYRLAVWHSGHYHMISISHLEDVPRLKDIARALESPLAEVAEDGRYRNPPGAPRLLGDCAEWGSLVHGVSLRYAPAISPIVVD